MADGWPEEQKPEFFDPLGCSDTEINELVGKAAGMATERTYAAMVEGTDTREVAREIIGNAGLLHALGYTTRAAEGLNLFESLNLPEAPETAGIYANYRKTRIAMLLRGGVHYSDDAVRSIVHEQEASPVQTPETSSWLYYTLAQKGDAVSFRKWFEPTLDAMLASEEETSEHNPFPEYERHQQLAEVLFDHIAVLRPDAWTHTAANPEEARGLMLAFLGIVRERLAHTPQKALLAERMNGYFHRITESPDRDLRDEAKELQFAMLQQGVESPVDRHQEHITDCRLHKRLIISLIGMSERRGMYKEQAQALLDTWEQAGMFKERDLAKMGRWREESQRRNAPRRKGRRHR